MNDFRFAFRQLLKNPGFTVVAVLTLALGVGANSAVFQLLNAVRLKTLPVARPAELIEVRVEGGNPGLGISDGSNAELTFPLWEQIRQHREAFAGLFAWGSAGVILGEGLEPRQINSLWVSGEFFSTLGLAPVRGRLLNPDDDQRGAGPGGVVISYAFWQKEFGGQDTAIGQSIKLNDRLFQIVGITPPDFFGLEVGKTFDVALPVTTRALWWNDVLDRRDAWWLRVMGRLKPGGTLNQAASRFKAVSPAIIEATVPVGYRAEAGERYRQFRLSAFPAGAGVSSLRSEYSRSLYLLLGITGLVLLIACVNLANLLLARAAVRRREIAVRLALGASRARLIGQLLVESLLLALAGAAAGTVLARWLSGGMVWFLNQDNALQLDLSSDWRVLVFTGGVAVITCVLFGLAPAVRSTRVAPAAALGAGGRVASHRESFALQRGLAVLQMAVSVVLLAGALLLARSFWNLVALNPGFRQDGIFVAYVNFSNQESNRYPVLKRELMEKIRGIPQVESAASTTHVPMLSGSWTMGVRVTGPDGPREGASKVAWVSPDFFRTMGIQMIAGRDFNDRDTTTSPKVALVNETFVRNHFGTANPVGTTLRTIAEPGYPEADYEIVGVVKDTKYGSLRDEVPPIAFAPATQHPIPGNWMTIVVHSAAPLPGVMATVKQRAAETDPAMRFGTSVFQSRIRSGLAREQLLAGLSGIFGVLASVLVLVGLYGLVSYITLTRQNELGIRLALGAQRGDILRLVLNQGLRLALLGVPLGLIGALAFTRLLRGLLFGVAPADPITLIVISLFLVAVASLASWLPARRASRVDPMVALRNE